MNDIKEFLLIAPIATPAISILMQIIKPIFGDNKKFIPLISIILWMIITVLVNFWRSFWLNIYQALIVGVLVWGSSTWLYETINNLKPKKI